MTQILPCGLDLAGLLMVQLVISALDAGQGRADKEAHGARGIRSETMSCLELLETLSALICSRSRQHWRLWRKKARPWWVLHHAVPSVGGESGAGFVPVGRTALCPVAPTPRDSTGHRVGYLDLGWMGEFPTAGCPAVMQFHKMLLLWMGRFGCFAIQTVVGRSLVFGCLIAKGWADDPGTWAALSVPYKRSHQQVRSSCGFCCHCSHFKHLPILCFL